MRKRNTPREVRDGFPYFVVDLADDNSRRITMRQPRASQMAVAVATIGQARESGVAERLAQADVTGRLEIAGELRALMAALVGLCWADLDHDLEAAPPTKADGLPAYGMAVLDELTEHGLGPTDVATLWGRSMIAVIGNERELLGAIDALGFTGRRGAAGSPSSASPPSNGTAATPTPSSE
jgi:hypothetical protein